MNDLTQDKVKELFEYKDGALFWKVSNNNFIQVGQKAGTSVNDSGYHIVGISGKTYRLHRIVFMYHHGYFPKNVDHIDGNRANNSIENLRPADDFQNSRNSRISKRNKSGVKGVCWANHVNKWLVQVRQGSSKKYLGLYDDLELAELVAIEARNKFHKEYANHGTY
jgi:hypothetical protein